METKHIIVILCVCSLAAVKATVQEDALAEHNRLRNLHDVAPLKLNDELTDRATHYAEKLANANHLMHLTSYGRFGENLCHVAHSPSQCTQSWYDEIKDYDFDKAQFTPETGHFTQLIWAESTEMGYAEVQALNGDFYAVALYSPPGNIKDSFKKNVPRPKEEKSGAVAVSTNAILLISIYYGLFKLLYC